MKLEAFGIEIYAAIDGYSRYILWIYVGVSARTGISVNRQFLDFLSTQLYQPKILRADLGSETSMIADAHFTLRKQQDPEAEPSDCFWYGRSTENQRIESWWGYLSKMSIFQYRVSRQI
jgi:hypothetical protein